MQHSARVYRHVAADRAAGELRQMQERIDAAHQLRDDWRDIRGGFGVTLTDGFDGQLMAYLPDPGHPGAVLPRRITAADLADIMAIAASTTHGLQDLRKAVPA